MGLISGKRLGIAATILLAVAGPVAAQQTPYYVFAGDSSEGFIVQNGVATTFTTFFHGYPPAIQSTIWLDERNNGGATEYTLAGVPTGNTSAGGGSLDQLLDGTTNGINNYAARFDTPEVTIANLDWSNQTSLFALPENPGGITYDPITNHLFVGNIRGTTLREYTLTGTLVNTFTAGALLDSLAYEPLTDTLWSAEDNQVFQMTKTGVLLNTITVTGAGFSNFANNFGGEMPFVGGGQPAAPEPGAALLTLVGLTAFGIVARRKR